MVLVSIACTSSQVTSPHMQYPFGQQVRSQSIYPVQYTKTIQNVYILFWIWNRYIAVPFSPFNQSQPFFLSGPSTWQVECVDGQLWVFLTHVLSNKAAW